MAGATTSRNGRPAVDGESGPMGVINHSSRTMASSRALPLYALPLWTDIYLHVSGNVMVVVIQNIAAFIVVKEKI